MKVKFTLEADCTIFDAEEALTKEELERDIELILHNHIGITAFAEVKELAVMD